MKSEPSFKQELRSIYMLAGLDSAQFEKVVQTSRIIKLAEGDKLFSHGEDARQFFQVRHGQIKLYRVSPEGYEKVIEIIMPGQTFAEAVMFMKRPSYPVNATALHDSELIAFDNATFIGILRQSVDTCFRVMADMSLWLHTRLNEIEALAVQNATLRLTNYLLQEIPKDTQGSFDIALDLPKYVLASRLSITPESLSRILQNLQKSDLITVEGQSIHIHDLEGLRSYGTQNIHSKIK